MAAFASCCMLLLVGITSTSSTSSQWSKPIAQVDRISTLSEDWVPVASACPTCAQDDKSHAVARQIPILQPPPPPYQPSTQNSYIQQTLAAQQQEIENHFNTKGLLPVLYNRPQQVYTQQQQPVPQLTLQSQHQQSAPQQAQLTLQQQQQSGPQQPQISLQHQQQSVPQKPQISLQQQRAPQPQEPAAPLQLLNYQSPPTIQQVPQPTALPPQRKQQTAVPQRSRRPLPPSTSAPEEEVQLLYVPVETLRQQHQAALVRQQQQLAQELQSLKQPTTEQPSTTPEPYQPPLSVYMGPKEGHNVKITDVIKVLKDAKTISVLDTVGPNSPQVFVGPSNLHTPEGYAKFELPYLSALDSNRVERKVDKHPFFVAPLSFKPPAGYSKIPFPAPHIGSVVVTNITDTSRERQHASKEYNLPAKLPPINPELPSLVNSLQDQRNVQLVPQEPTFTKFQQVIHQVGVDTETTTKSARKQLRHRYQEARQPEIIQQSRSRLQQQGRIQQQFPQQQQQQQQQQQEQQQQQQEQQQQQQQQQQQEQQQQYSFLEDLVPTNLQEDSLTTQPQYSIPFQESKKPISQDVLLHQSQYPVQEDQTKYTSAQTINTARQTHYSIKESQQPQYSIPLERFSTTSPTYHTPTQESTYVNTAAEIHSVPAQIEYQTTPKVLRYSTEESIFIIPQEKKTTHQPQHLSSQEELKSKYTIPAEDVSSQQPQYVSPEATVLVKPLKYSISQDDVEQDQPQYAVSVAGPQLKHSSPDAVKEQQYTSFYEETGIPVTTKQSQYDATLQPYLEADISTETTTTTTPAPIRTTSSRRNRGRYRHYSSTTAASIPRNRALQSRGRRPTSRTTSETPQIPPSALEHSHTFESNKQSSQVHRFESPLRDRNRSRSRGRVTVSSTTTPSPNAFQEELYEPATSTQHSRTDTATENFLQFTSPNQEQSLSEQIAQSNLPDDQEPYTQISNQKGTYAQTHNDERQHTRIQNAPGPYTHTITEEGTYTQIPNGQRTRTQVPNRQEIYSSVPSGQGQFQFSTGQESYNTDISTDQGIQNGQISQSHVLENQEPHIQTSNDYLSSSQIPSDQGPYTQISNEQVLLTQIPAGRQTHTQISSGQRHQSPIPNNRRPHTHISTDRRPHTRISTDLASHPKILTQEETHTLNEQINHSHISTEQGSYIQGSTGQGIPTQVTNGPGSYSQILTAQESYTQIPNVDEVTDTPHSQVVNSDKVRGQILNSGEVGNNQIPSRQVIHNQDKNVYDSSNGQLLYSETTTEAGPLQFLQQELPEPPEQTTVHQHSTLQNFRSRTQVPQPYRVRGDSQIVTSDRPSDQKDGDVQQRPTLVRIRGRVRSRQRVEQTTTILPPDLTTTSRKHTNFLNRNLAQRTQTVTTSTPPTVETTTPSNNKVYTVRPARRPQQAQTKLTTRGRIRRPTRPTTTTSTTSTPPSDHRLNEVPDIYTTEIVPTTRRFQITLVPEYEPVPYQPKQQQYQSIQQHRDSIQQYQPIQEYFPDEQNQQYQPLLHYQTVDRTAQPSGNVRQYDSNDPERGEESQWSTRTISLNSNNAIPYVQKYNSDQYEVPVTTVATTTTTTTTTEKPSTMEEVSTTTEITLPVLTTEVDASITSTTTEVPKVGHGRRRGSWVRVRVRPQQQSQDIFETAESQNLATMAAANQILRDNTAKHVTKFPISEGDEDNLHTLKMNSGKDFIDTTEFPSNQGSLDDPNNSSTVSNFQTKSETLSYKNQVTPENQDKLTTLSNIQDEFISEDDIGVTKSNNREELTTYTNFQSIDDDFVTVTEFPNNQVSRSSTPTSFSSLRSDAKNEESIDITKSPDDYIVSSVQEKFTGSENSNKKSIEHSSKPINLSDEENSSKNEKGSSSNKIIKSTDVESANISSLQDTGKDYENANKVPNDVNVLQNQETSSSSSSAYSNSRTSDNLSKWEDDVQDEASNAENSSDKFINPSIDDEIAPTQPTVQGYVSLVDPVEEITSANKQEKETNENTSLEKTEELRLTSNPDEAVTTTSSEDNVTSEPPASDSYIGSLLSSLGYYGKSEEKIDTNTNWGGYDNWWGKSYANHRPYYTDEQLNLPTETKKQLPNKASIWDMDMFREYDDTAEGNENINSSTEPTKYDELENSSKHSVKKANPIDKDTKTNTTEESSTQNTEDINKFTTEIPTSSPEETTTESSSTSTSTEYTATTTTSTPSSVETTVPTDVVSRPNIKRTDTRSLMARILGTTTSTKISHETEICYRGRCIKTKTKQSDIDQMSTD